ncbi:hypothetical protein GCM10008956_24630 [Deinococcus arenae]|uniref:Immunity protein Imm5 domain-containing protein n=1 Tax=Deinococcus arenae TaxID=1452751 RepID=A0A8H9GQG5_9DEIO|nr:Imm5 family immunity protein [Deinococcus arenae]AWT34293.1 hypothetical protein DM785_01060 [Deinococcus actinosclerus]GGM47554.1 hypothetical protein GCM10008956_24630 [Deinococcus arenae]
MSHEQLNAWRERFRAAVQAHPRHHLHSTLRRDFYLDLDDDLFTRRFQGWLAVLAAQRVLPILMEFTPYEALPFREINACIRLLRRDDELQQDEVADIVDHGYHASGTFAGSDLVTDVQYFHVAAVERAAYKALLEVAGWRNPFDRAVPPGTPDDQWPDDEHWAMLGVGDTAGCAAVAASCSATSFTCDPQRLLAFWTWWLDTAWPQAEQYAGMGVMMYGLSDTDPNEPD